MSQKIAPAAIVALKDALTSLYWYKKDLRSFLSGTIEDPNLLGGINWNDYKRNIVGLVVDRMAKREDRYQSILIRVMAEVCRVEDFSHLERLEDGASKADAARISVAALRKLTRGHESLVEEQKKAEERRRQAHETLLRNTAVRIGLDKLNKQYVALLMDRDHHRRGYQLEILLRNVFELFDLDPRASFKISGEQIDGAFTFESTDYLFEAKWEEKLISAQDLDVLHAKLSRKLDNTLGLFLSINGFSDDGVAAHSSGRRMMLLFDGSDLMAVLDGRIDLIQLLLRKRREASQTGNIYLKFADIM